MLTKTISIIAVLAALCLGSACGHKAASSSTSPTSSGSAAAEPAGSGSGSGLATCESAGGKCVGLTPTACADGKVGDAKQYSCGTGLGVECCLPK